MGEIYLFFIIFAKIMEKNNQDRQWGLLLVRNLFGQTNFFTVLVTYQNDRPVKGRKSPQPTQPKFEDRKWSVGLSVGSRGRHSDKFSCSVRPTAEPRSKILACPTESRAEPNCPIVRKSLGSAPEHFFGQIRTVGQPNSRDSRSILSIGFMFFFWFSLIVISV